VAETVNTPVTAPVASILHVAAAANNPTGLSVTELQGPGAPPTKPEPKIAIDTPLTPEAGLRMIRGLRTKLTGPTRNAPGLAVTETA
jgi:hypothetical protein